MQENDKNVTYEMQALIKRSGTRLAFFTTVHVLGHVARSGYYSEPVSKEEAIQYMDRKSRLK